ncbi:MAG: hypothetical protein AB7S44_01670 [Spirochaetales bacterium]
MQNVLKPKQYELVYNSLEEDLLKRFGHYTIDAKNKNFRAFSFEVGTLVVENHKKYGNKAEKYSFYDKDRNLIWSGTNYNKYNDSAVFNSLTILVTEKGIVVAHDELDNRSPFAWKGKYECVAFDQINTYILTNNPSILENIFDMTFDHNNYSYSNKNEIPYNEIETEEISK